MTDPINDPRFPVIYFDGVCNLCNRSVRWLIRRDAKKTLRFASLQSQHARRHLPEALRASAASDTVLFTFEGRCWQKSDAWLEALRRLGGAWSAVAWLRWLPRSWRDGMYDVIARNRYRWFGRLETCQLPEPGIRERFLD